MSTLRSVIFVIWLYAGMAISGALYFPWAIFSPRGVNGALRFWCRWTLFGLHWIIGARVTIDGQENLPQGPMIVACKHHAMLDTMLPALFLDFPAFVYKEELKGTPVLGWYLQAGRNIPVARDEGATALKSMLRASRQAIAEGRQILIFPEGTRRRLDEPTDYKSGVFAVYRGVNAPCVPVALSTGLIWKPKGLMRSPGHARVKILPPIAPGLSRDDFMRELEARIETESQALLPPERRRTPAA